MTKEEIFNHRQRFIDKIAEMQTALHKLEQEYLSNSPYKIGDKVILKTSKVKNKEVHEYGIVSELFVEYQKEGVSIRVVINDEKSGKYAKTVYI
jgi:hypothetical protein